MLIGLKEKTTFVYEDFIYHLSVVKASNVILQQDYGNTLQAWGGGRPTGENNWVYPKFYYSMFRHHNKNRKIYYNLNTIELEILNPYTSEIDGNVEIRTPIVAVKLYQWHLSYKATMEVAPPTHTREVYLSW